MKTLSKSFFFLGVALLLALRLWHFGSVIDAPHDWRQCDTAYYIWDFYQHGIDLLHPAVCWMGGKNTLALEFPLPEAIVALAYQAFGESLPLARLIFLGFFAAGLFYFYKITDLLFDRQLAQLATLVYLALPLSIFYSRAIHIDFSAIFLTHAMLYYYLIGVQKRAWKHLLWSSLIASLAFVIKAPYAFYWAFPMLYFAIQQKALWWVLRRGVFYALALAVFWLWQKQVLAINSTAPDWNYILHYRKMTQSASWYFGSLSQRLSLYHWWVLLKRGILDVAGIGGIAFFIFGWWRLKQLPHFRFLLFWMLGLVIYILIFFNLNFVHNYYQLPLLAPVAILCARGLQIAVSFWPKMLFFFFGFLLVLNFSYTEVQYFKVAEEHLEMGYLIRQHTPDSALVIVSYSKMDCRNPKVLYRARRRGWSIEEAALRPEVIERLHQEEGAQFWIYVGNELPKLKLGNILSTFASPRIFDLTTIPKKMFIFDLQVSKVQ